jgi:hypothetical protein
LKTVCLCGSGVLAAFPGLSKRDEDVAATAIRGSGVLAAFY